jgi:hypothetical protein
VPVNVGPNEKLLFMARTCVKYFIGDACEEGSKQVAKVGDMGLPVTEALNVTICREHCTFDGCNVAASRGPAMPWLWTLCLACLALGGF